MKTLLSGNEAIARGAWEAGCNVAASYPGTPASEILEEIAKYKEIYAEWSTNEKVAFDVVSGASFAGARVLVSMKHVGLNVAADSLFSMSYSGATGGFIIISADDPGMWSSQNEQDNRWYAVAAKIPMLEPSDSQEAKDFVHIGYEISEKFDTPVLLRITTRIAHSKSVVELAERKEHKPKGYEKNVKKRLFLPANARIRHPFVEERLKKLQKFNETFTQNRIEWGSQTVSRTKQTEIGIITSGISYQYVKEVFPDAPILKLSMTYPIPPKLIKSFAKKVKKLYVIEEGDPFIENQIKMLGVKVIGKEKVPICGELDQSVIRKIFNPQPVTHNVDYGPTPARPPILCAGCPHRGVFYTLNKLKIHASGDIGCYTLGALPPLNAIDTCICMGASIGNAQGINVAIPEMSNKLVAVIGDSTFFHAGIPSLINIVYNKSPTTVIILDNLTTAMTGNQPHPGTGKTIKGESTKVIKIEEIAKSCGVERVFVIDPYNLKETKEVIKREININEPSVIIARRSCALRTKREKPLIVDEEICIGCKLCIELGCPAIIFKNGKAKIDPVLCNGCGLCLQVCVKKAIKTDEEEQ